MRSVHLLGACCAVALAACGGSGGSDPGPGPRVDLIPDAIAAAEASYGGPQEYFEISASNDSVSVVVAVDDATGAEQGGITADGGLTVFEPVGEASGATFTADQVAFDADAIFDQLRDELDDPVIIDFAIQGGSNGAAIYDATVASESGGVLLVLLAGDGTILGVQGR